MTNEEFDRRIDFILGQQAQFATDIQQLREAQAQTDQVVNRLAAATLEGFKDVNAKLDALVDSQVRLADAQAALSEDFKGASAKIDALADSHVRLADAHARLAESQALTDEKLRHLMTVVDRYFSEGRNGKSNE